MRVSCSGSFCTRCGNGEGSKLVSCLAWETYLRDRLLALQDTEEGDQPDLKAVQAILEESFDPIIDMITRTDLLPVMVASGSYGEWDYSGMYSLLLRMEGVPVAAAICRVFGTRVAELPLIATTHARRREVC